MDNCWPEWLTQHTVAPALLTVSPPLAVLLSTVHLCCSANIFFFIICNDALKTHAHYLSWAQQCHWIHLWEYLNCSETSMTLKKKPRHLEHRGSNTTWFDYWKCLGIFCFVLRAQSLSHYTSGQDSRESHGTERTKSWALGILSKTEFNSMDQQVHHTLSVSRQQLEVIRSKRHDDPPIYSSLLIQNILYINPLLHHTSPPLEIHFSIRT